MAHEIFGNRFYSRREPAWHKLGLVLDEDLSASDAFERFGPYEIECRPIRIDGNELIASHQAIVRCETNKGEVAKILNVVGKDFTPVGPRETCGIFDRAVKQPVETIGALRDGAFLFITTKLPAFDVRGDEVQDYLTVVNPMDGGESAHVMRTPVRIVCMNTLRMGQNLSIERYNLRHTKDIANQMFEWLGGLFLKAVEQAARMKEAAEHLTTFMPDDMKLAAMLKAIYPEPKPIRNTAPREVLIKREEHRQYAAEHQAAHRQVVTRLFRGEGTGMDTPAARNTGWGLYNAVVEYEDNRWSRNPQAAVESSVFGPRAEVKELAFDTIYAAATIGA